MRRAAPRAFHRALWACTVVLPLLACEPDVGVQPLPSQVEAPDRADPPLQQGQVAQRAPISETPTGSGHGPPYPVILVHGFSGFNSLGPLEYFFRVIDALAEAGETEVFAPALPPYNSVEARAPFLAGFIDEVIAETGAAKVHIIAHSQGGLDARRVISALGYADRVATLTTVATPHRGTPIADYVIDGSGTLLDPVARTLAWLIGAVDSPDNPSATDDPNWREDMEASARSLSSAGVAAFNEAHPDPPEVAIFSVAGVSNFQHAHAHCALSRWGRLQRVDAIDPLLSATALVLSGPNPLRPVPNDGILPTASMIWGEFLGCIPADHFDEVGQIADLLPGLFSGFDHLEFYRDLVAHIRAWELEHAERPTPP